MNAYVFTSEKRNDCIIIIATTSFIASVKLEEILKNEGNKEEYIFQASTRCVGGNWCSATITPF